MSENGQPSKSEPQNLSASGVITETGWNAFEARMYEQIIGRWMAVDPSRQFYSPYLGMGNNPVNGVDPDGKDWYEVDGKIVWFSVTGDFSDNAGVQYQSLGNDLLSLGSCPHEPEKLT